MILYYLHLLVFSYFWLHLIIGSFIQIELELLLDIIILWSHHLLIENLKARSPKLRRCSIIPVIDGSIPGWITIFVFFDQHLLLLELGLASLNDMVFAIIKCPFSFWSYMMARPFKLSVLTVVLLAILCCIQLPHIKSDRLFRKVNRIEIVYV